MSRGINLRVKLHRTYSNFDFFLKNGYFQNRFHEATTPRSKMSQQATPRYFVIGQNFGPRVLPNFWPGPNCG